MPDVLPGAAPARRGGLAGAIRQSRQEDGLGSGGRGEGGAADQHGRPGPQQGLWRVGGDPAFRGLPQGRAKGRMGLVIGAEAADALHLDDEKHRRPVPLSGRPGEAPQSG